MKLEKKIYFPDFSLLVILLLLSFFLRLVIAYIFGDQNIENEWKIITYSLINDKSYSFYNFNGERLPCVYMPPMYPFFLYFIKIISLEKIDFINLIIFSQVILSTIAVYFFYKINNKIFNKNLSLINSFIFSFFPLNLYAAGQISSVSFQLFFSLIFLSYFFSICEKQNLKNIIIFSIVSGILILTRGEFILIFILTMFYIFFIRKINFKNLIKIILIVLLVISPYIIRNYLTFNQIVIVKSLGFNLWKGNNQYSLIGGTSVSPPVSYDKSWKNFDKPEYQELKTKLENIKIDKFYEIRRDDIFLTEAIKNIKEDYGRYINLFLEKILSFFFVDFNSEYPNYFNHFYFLPTLVLSLLSFPGIFLAFKKKDFKFNYLLFYLFLNLFIFSVFFILPRYKLSIIPIQIMLATYFLNYVYERFFSKK